MSKIGRNDPCPCGSGKKYKHCCGGSAEKVIPFPGTENSRFGDSLADSDYDGTTMMEQLGRPNMATAILKELQASLSGHSFTTDAELQETMAQLMDRHNTAGVPEFLGLSPTHMRHIMYDGPQGMEGIFVLGTDVRKEDIPAVPLLESSLFLLERLIETGGVKATAKGNLPRALVLEAWERVYAPKERSPQVRDILKPSKEDDLWDLRYTRHILRKAKLIKYYDGRFSATQMGKTLFASGDLGALYRELFLSTAWGIDWNEGRSNLQALHPITQQTFVFNLHLLAEIAQDWTSQDTLTDAYVAAFPDLYTPEDAEEDDRGFMKLMVYSAIFYGLSHFPEQLGLLESNENDLAPQELLHAKYRITPFFRRILRPQV